MYILFIIRMNCWNSSKKCREFDRNKKKDTGKLLNLCCIVENLKPKLIKIIQNKIDEKVLLFQEFEVANFQMFV